MTRNEFITRWVLGARITETDLERDWCSASDLIDQAEEDAKALEQAGLAPWLTHESCLEDHLEGTR